MILRQQEPQEQQEAAPERKETPENQEPRNSRATVTVTDSTAFH